MKSGARNTAFKIFISDTLRKDTKLVNTAVQFDICQITKKYINAAIAMTLILQSTSSLPVTVGIWRVVASVFLKSWKEGYLLRLGN